MASEVQPEVDRSARGELGNPARRPNLDREVRALRSGRAAAKIAKALCAGPSRDTTDWDVELATKVGRRARNLTLGLRNYGTRWERPPIEKLVDPAPPSGCRMKTTAR